MVFSDIQFWGLAGTLVVILSSAATALLYHGNQGERFSMLNHFVSELGEPGVSKGARLFNAGLILGGLLFLPFLIGLGVTLNSWLGWLGTVVGVIAGLALIGVGIYPMNDLEKHSVAAMLFFRAGLGMILLYGLAFWFQPASRTVMPYWTVLLSALAAGCYASFLLITRPKDTDEDPVEALDPESAVERPRIWIIPIVEWLVFFSTICWLFGVTLAV